MNASGVPTNLFGRGIGECHVAERGPSVIKRIAIGFKLFGDSEIEEAHGAI